MGRRLYVGIFRISTGKAELQELFQQSGERSNRCASCVTPPPAGRGFAFVEMATDEEAQKAASELISIRWRPRADRQRARPKPEGGFGGGGFGGNRGGGGGGGRREPRW